MNRLARLNALHLALRRRRHPVSAQELMVELECSRSTLYRTIGMLRDHFDAPVVNRPGLGYIYDGETADSFELPGLWFRREELEALLVMDQLLNETQPSVLGASLAPLRKRLKRILDQGCSGAEPFPAHRFRLLRAHPREVSAREFQIVASAIVERRQVRFTYEARSSGETTRRTASPLRLVYYRDQWYWDCWDEGRDSLRTFSLDRTSEAERLAAAARDVPRERLSEHYGAGYGIYAGPPKGEARLRFTPRRTRWVADERWHWQQSAQRLPDGSLELTVPYSEVEELVSEILRYGPDVQVLEPPELVEIVRQRLQQAVEQYR